jgi:hypothetical protein
MGGLKHFEEVVAGALKMRLLTSQWVCGFAQFQNRWMMLAVCSSFCIFMLGCMTGHD